ncbi:MAG TPA: toll/interleukin-1 receptor domain-containing protein [Polyangiales bacterium]|nr:toll/interleukin-1 receptor domain-containing protein [Polyangiales bacterium]
MTAPPPDSDRHAFVAYRRECGHAALALARTLRRGGREVFRDIEGLRGGDIWADTVRAAIEKASAVIVLIDSSWNAAPGNKRDPRLWTEHDPLRMEIRHAIKHGIPLIPVLIDDTPMPQSAELPTDIRALCERHGVRLRHTEFESDVQRIAADIESVTRDREAISAVIERLGAEHTAVAQSNTPGRASALDMPVDRGSMLNRLSAFKPSALLESLSSGKADDIRSILANLARPGAASATPHPVVFDTSEEPVAQRSAVAVPNAPAREKARF